MPSRIALIVRGHERGAFADRAFADYAGGMASRLGADVRVFVHTWNESEAKVSHRPLFRNKVRPITEADVRSYLGESVARVIVDDDRSIELVGSAEGMIGGIPARAWKNMWYGKHRAAGAVRSCGERFDLVVCVRVDNFLNMESRRYAGARTDTMDAACRRALVCDDPRRIHFVRGGTYPGVDNFYAGRPEAVFRLIDRFHFSMDEVRAAYPGVRHQEYLVVYEASRLETS